MKKHQIILATCAFAVILCGHVVSASESQGAIVSGSNLTKICKSVDCSSYGSINWKPTLNANTTGATAITITDTSISGYLWGDEIGWVNMQPTGYGVTVNPNTGVLSGYAYANVGSWVNFSPSSVSGGTPVGVSINSSGQFTGWAYVSGIYGGWMKFDCSSSATCITTDWRPIANRASATDSPASPGTSYSSSGSTPERQAADLAAIWAYNGIQITPTSTPPFSPASVSVSPGKDRGEQVATNPSNGQQGGVATSGNTTIKGSNGTDQNSSSTNITNGNDAGFNVGFWQNIFQSPIAMILAVLVILLLLLLLRRIRS